MEHSVTHKDEIFLDEEEYFESKNVTTPDCLIRAYSLDHGDRALNSLPYPFSDEIFKSKSGCYFFFDSYLYDGDIADFAPLYVGKTIQFNKRLYRHWSSSDNDITDYLHSHIFNTGKYDVPLYKGAVSKEDMLIPNLDIKVAIWFESNEKERMFLEHELIYKLRPMFNKA